MAMALFSMAVMVGPAIGPTLGGYIVDNFHWSWIFFINVPVGVLGMVAVARFVPPLRPPDPGRFDGKGFALSVLAITALMGAAETVGIGLLPPPVQLATVALAVGASVAFVAHARRAERPVLDLGLLRHDTFRASLMGGTFLRLGLGATPFLLPLLFQVGLGWGPLETGLVTIGTGLGAMACKPVAPLMLRRFGFRSILILTNVLTAVLTALPATFRATTPVPLIVTVLVVGGFVRSLQFTSLNTVAYADIPGEAVTAASTLSVVTQQMGVSLGISFGGLMLHLARGGDDTTPLTPERFILPFIAVGVVSMLAGPLYRRLSPDAGASIGGRRAA